MALENLTRVGSAFLLIFVPNHLLPVAAVLCVLLVAVAVGLAQLDQFEQIQQEGHLKHF